MLNQFSRTQLLFGPEAMKILSSSVVAVFGIGGVGSYAAEALARSGVGGIALFDDDAVCVTNINRQLVATLSTIGKSKVEVMRDRILDINRHAKVEVNQVFYGADNADQYDLSKYSYIIDAIDTVSCKLVLIERAKAAGVPIISCMGAGNKLDPTAFEVADIYKTTVCPLAKVMRRELRVRGVESLKVVYSREIPLPLSEADEISCKHNCVCPPESTRNCAVRRQVPGSNAFVPSVAGLILAGEAIKDLTNIHSVRM
ncbi:MAG TPA: tRNA threonylcarbamoyladenosine dehydratase [Sedimentisphaerales bacterium]